MCDSQKTTITINIAGKKYVCIDKDECILIEKSLEFYFSNSIGIDAANAADLFERLSSIEL